MARNSTETSKLLQVSAYIAKRFHTSIYLKSVVQIVVVILLIAVGLRSFTVPLRTVTLLNDPLQTPAGSTLATTPSNHSPYSYGFLQNEYAIVQVDGSDYDVLAVDLHLDGYPNVVVAVNARLVGDPKQKYVAIACRSLPIQPHWTEYRLAVTPSDGEAELERWDSDKGAAVLQNWKYFPEIRRGNSWNRLELSCVDDVIAVRVNGVQVGQVLDHTYRVGGVWIGGGKFGGADKSVLAEVHFQDLVVGRCEASDVQLMYLLYFLTNGSNPRC